MAKFLTELEYDIKKWATIDEISSAYPELQNNIKTIQELHYDISNGATIDEVQRAYPEFSQFIWWAVEKTKWQFIWWAKRIYEAWVWWAEWKYDFAEASLRWWAGALQMAWSPISWILWETIETWIEKIPEDIRKDIKEKAIPTIEWIQEWYKEQSPEQRRRLDNAWIWLEVLASFIWVKWIQKVTAPLTQTWKQAVTQTATQVKQTLNPLLLRTIKKARGKVIDKADVIWKAVNKKAGQLREYMAWLDPKDLQAIETATPKKVVWLIEQAKKANLSRKADYTDTPYYEWAQEALRAFEKLEKNVRWAQKKRTWLIEKSWVKKIDTGDVRTSIVEDIKDTFNITWAKKTKAWIKYKTVKWRKSLLDEWNLKDYEAMKLLESVTKSTPPLEMMDTIKKMQNLIYDTNILNRVSKDMKALVTRSIWKLNKTFKSQVWKKYQTLLDDMSWDIRLMKDLDRVFKAGVWEIGNKWEMAMKRLVSWTTTSWEARNLALKIKDRLWIDLIQEARLRKIAMDISWDTRANTLFQTIKEGKQWIIWKTLEWIIEKTPLSKEKTVISRAGKTLKSKKTKNANINRNTTNTSNTWNKSNTKSGIIPKPKLIGSNNGKVVKTITKTKKKPTKKIIKKTVNEKDEIIKDLKKLTWKIRTPDQIKRVATDISKKLWISKEKIWEVVKIINQYIKKYWAELKNKLRDLSDEIADKLWARSKFIWTDIWNPFLEYLPKKGTRNQFWLKDAWELYKQTNK